MGVGIVREITSKGGARVFAGCFGGCTDSTPTMLAKTLNRVTELVLLSYAVSSGPSGFKGRQGERCGQLRTEIDMCAGQEVQSRTNCGGVGPKPIPTGPKDAGVL
uniref:U1764ac n=1 Tax=Mycobacterium leprae TaxID=1769 RepID=Q50013_MYCLR|nr:u1764ac [Mycobacterium leprae]CAB08129.1 unknown [Mycobacterium leprae]CAB08296.1 hypothetical protein MLC1351.27c [Mycobacterium leprae]